MTKYKVAVKFHKIAIPNEVIFDNKGLAESYKKEWENSSANIVWVTLEEVKA